MQRVTNISHYKFRKRSFAKKGILKVSMSSKKVMGILNTTLDSFYDKGRFYSFEKAIERGIQMYREGADWIDIGGESSRPGAESIPEEEELKRTIPVIKELKNLISIPLSIDTMKPRVAEAAMDAGATLINDVSGFRHPEMIKLALERKVAICVMHMLETPATMQGNPNYPGGVVPNLLAWFQKKVENLLYAGIEKEKIILDPGIGFGKTVADNLQILHNLQRFKAMGFPLLIGLSRKSFMSKTIHKPAAELLPTTIAMNTIALLANIDIIRVHDVGVHRDVVDMLEKYQKVK
jgi:dihydropteroate synthase